MISQYFSLVNADSQPIDIREDDWAAYSELLVVGAAGPAFDKDFDRRCSEINRRRHEIEERGRTVPALRP